MMAPEFETNEKGELLVNVCYLIRCYALETMKVSRWRYNGGWTKRIDALDKTHTTGHSLVGPFVDNKINWTKPGLYLDCDIGGSRSNQRRSYYLFRLGETGELTLLDDEGDSKNWAVNLWPAVGKALAEKEPAPLAPFPAEDETAAWKEAALMLEARLHAIDPEGAASVRAIFGCLTWPE